MKSGRYVVDENGKRVAKLQDIKYDEVVAELKRSEDELTPFDQGLREIGEGQSRTTMPDILPVAHQANGPEVTRQGPAGGGPGEDRRGPRVGRQARAAAREQAETQGRSEYRLRAGNYRAIYAVDGEERVVAVLQVGHQRDV